MTREKERAVRGLLRRLRTAAVAEVPAWHTPHNDPERIMDELWVQKAALGELLRRGWFDQRGA